MADRRNRTRADSEGESLRTLTGMYKILGSIDSKLDDLPTTPSDFNKSSTKKTNQTIDQNTKSNKSVTEALNNDVKALDKSTKATLTLGGLVKSSVQGVISFVGKKLDSAYDSVVSAFESNYNRTTARMNLSSMEYAQVFNDAVTQFRKDGTEALFTSVDYIEQLNENLSLGLRGDAARQKTYSDLLTKKVLPSFNTNTKALKSLTIQFGNTTFQDTLTTVAHSLEGGNYSAVEEGDLSTMIDTFYSDMNYISSITGTSMESIGNNMLSAVDQWGEMGLQAGDLFDLWNSVTSSSPGDGSLMSIISGGVTPEEMGEIFADPQRLEQFMENLTANISEMGYSGMDTINVLSQELGVSQETAKNLAAISNRMAAGEKIDFSIKELTEKQKEELTYQLKEDAKHYESATEKANNLLTNATTGLAVLTQQVPYGNEILEGILSKVSELVVAVVGGGFASGIGSAVGSSAAGAGGAAAGTALGVAALGVAVGSIVGEVNARVGNYIADKIPGVEALDEEYMDSPLLMEAFQAHSELAVEKAKYNVMKEQADSEQAKYEDKFIKMFDDPSSFPSNKKLLRDKDGDGLPDNKEMAKAFKAWREENKDKNYTIGEYIDEYNPTEGSHKKGLAEVPYDDYTATLHKGEMVVPANDAENLRKISGVSDYIQSETSSASVIVSASADVSSKLSSAISKHTDTMVSKFNEVISTIYLLMDQTYNVVLPDNTTYDYGTN